MIGVVTDSSCDLPDDLLEQAGVAVVPLTIRFGAEEMVDREDISPDDFWRRLPDADELPQTAAPSPGRFEAAYRRLAAAGAEGVVAVCISSALSGTFQSAQIAASAVAGEVPVRVVDSRLTSAALGLATLAAADAADAGGGLEEVEAAARRAAAGRGVLGALDTLEFLKRGGRIGGAQALLGDLLSVKPLITLEDGQVVPAGRVRTRRKALAALIDHVRGLAPQLDALVVVHGAAPDVDAFAAALTDVVPPERITVSTLGPVVGTHAGPGLIGVCHRLG